MATDVHLCEKCRVHNVYGYVAEYCCNGTDCGCMGLPIHPCWCEDCWNRYDADNTKRASQSAKPGVT